jgi:cysteine desulfurase
MLANNETGTIPPVKELAQIARERGVLFHTDAVQAVGKMSVDVRDLGVDLLSLSAHKFYGPKGAGALYVRTGTPLDAHTVGGGQEMNLRSGTENVAAVAGLAEAIRLLQENPDRHSRAVHLAEEFTAKLFAAVPDIRLHGHPERRIKSTVNLGFSGVNGEALVIALDLRGIAVSSGSACSTGATQPSHVLRAMGLDRAAAESSIRFSFGYLNTASDIDRIVVTVAAEVARLRGMSPVYQAGA